VNRPPTPTRPDRAAEPASLRRAAAPSFRWRDEIAIALVLALLAAGLALGAWVWRLERVVYDLGLTLWSRPAPADIVIVAIDDASIDAIGRWPWRRAVHASLLERMAQAQPKAVALDIVLSEPDPDPEQDRLLARALARSLGRQVPVVVPVAWQSTYSASLAITEPVAVLREHLKLGASEAPVDPDGVLRHAFLSAGPAQAPYPHFALALLQAGGGQVHEKVRAVLDNGNGASAGPTAGPSMKGGAGDATAPVRDGYIRDGRLLIRYVGPPRSIDTVSYVDVLSGAVPASQLAGRYVFVGMTAQGLGDTLATPVNGRHESMPGVEALANVLYTLRSGDTIRSASPVLVAALSGALLTALVWSFGRFGPRRALPTAVAAVPLAVLASLWALRTGLWCSPVPFALPAVLAYPLWSWRRLERAVTGLDQEIARLAAEPLVAANVLEGEAAAVGAITSRASDAGDDIEARLHTLRRAGTVVRQARRFLADSLAALPTAMLVADEQAHVLLANPKAALLFEVDSAEELQGLDLARLLAEFSTATPFDWPAAAAALDPGGAGVAVEGTLRRVATTDAPGGAGDYVVHLAAVDLQGQRRLIVTIADIAPVKQAQREREEALAFVSHDLRSPASSIVLLADLNLKQPQPAANAELLYEMRRLAVRTLSLSEEFVRAAQVQTLPLQRVPLSLQALMDDALVDLRAQAQAAQVTLQTSLQPDPEAGLVLDRALVSRAIGNLVSNAIKHSPRGATVAVTGQLQEDQLVLGVRDRGPGLSASQMAQLARGDQGALVRDARGVGLGLLFVQRVARRHGGSLQARAPTEGAGALFELVLPVQGG
jgi:CHASE2 domain-containing sensor protein/signal transduction histidine kinase